MTAELGICCKCTANADCLNTNIGWMCRPCFHKIIKSGKSGMSGVDRVFTLPDPGQRLFVIMLEPGTYATVGGILYAFARKVDADELADGIRQGGEPGVFVEEQDARFSTAYVLAHNLRLVGVAGKAPVDPENSSHFQFPLE